MNWDLRHRNSALVIRLLLAVWIAVVVVVLCATDVGGAWCSSSPCFLICTCSAGSGGRFRPVARR